MKLQFNEAFSSAILPEQGQSIIERKTDACSELGQSVIGNSFNQVYDKKSDLNLVTQQLYKENPYTRKWYIITGVLTVLLIASISINIYFGIKANSNHGQKVFSREIKINYFGSCSDSVYEITVPNISGKRVIMNVTHWPDCFINRNFPKSGDSESRSETPFVNQFPPAPLKDSGNKTNPENNQARFSSETDNLIYIQQHNIAILAWVYNNQ